jgi:hypothetical protein
VPDVYERPNQTLELTAWPGMITNSQHVCEIRPRKDKRGDLISDVLPFGALWYGEPKAVANTIGRSHDAVIRVYDEAGKVIETHEHTGDFKEW